jgi:phenylalanyl-tRNA synthetase beta chain
MKASVKWLKELLPDLRCTAATIAKKLTALGVEVEGREPFERRFEGMVTVEVRGVDAHPGSTEHSVVCVFDGEGTHTVVTTDRSVERGHRLVWARPGTRVSGGAGILDKKAIRGIESEGMLLSEAELGLSAMSDVLLRLRPRTRAGKEVGSVLGVTDEVLELSVTPNRSDLLCHLGLARELAAAYGLESPKPVSKVREAGENASKLVEVSVKNTSLCPHYAGRVIRGIQVAPSPFWLRARLLSLGIRPISNVVDATNLVMMELGQPLHAFDLGRIHGGTVRVRVAESGESIELLDGSKRTLSSQDLVIADAEVPVALAGVMGGSSTEVSSHTKDIFLESARFQPETVRKTSRQYGLHTEASHRFERGVDPSQVIGALERCAALIADLAGGRVQRGRLEVGGAPAVDRVVSIRPARASRVLGRPISRGTVRDTLGTLGIRSVRSPEDPVPARSAQKTLRPKKVVEDRMAFRIPPWRLDLAIEEDLIEEVMRMTGYDNLVSLLPSPVQRKPTEDRVDDERLLREWLGANRFFEAVSLAFHSEQHASWLGKNVTQAVRLTNPLGEERRLMRMSLLPALLKSARLNQDQLPSLTDLRLFELGKSFRWTQPPQALPEETRKLGVLLRGRRLSKVWCETETKLDAYDIKGLVESVLSLFRAPSAVFKVSKEVWLHPRSATDVWLGSVCVGAFGELHPDLMGAFGLEGPPCFVAELSLDALVAHRGSAAVYHPLPRLPPAQRDLSFFVAEGIPAGDILTRIRRLAPDVGLESVELFDVYRGQGVPDGKKSLAVSLVFRSAQETLAESDIETAERRVVQALEKDFLAEIRSGA